MIFNIILIQIKKCIYLINILIFIIGCSKLCDLPFIKNKYENFFNEFLNINPELYQQVIGSPIYYSGNFISTNKIDIITCNHFNHYDCFIISSVIKTFSQKPVYTIIKKDLEKLPIIGKFSKGNLKLDRDIINDKERIINFIKKLNYGIIIILPEGTKLNHKNFKESQEYSKENNLKIYNKLLYPKLKGIYTIVEELKKK